MKKGQTDYLIDTRQIICVVYEIGTYFLTLITRGIFLARLHDLGEASDTQSMDTHWHSDIEGPNLYPVSLCSQENLAHLMSGTSHNGWENSSGSIVPSKACLAEPWAIVTHQGGAVLFFTHRGWSASQGPVGNREEAAPDVIQQLRHLCDTPTFQAGFGAPPLDSWGTLSCPLSNTFISKHFHWTAGFL